MKSYKLLSGTAALSLCATTALAGALDRSGQDITALFDEGRVFTFSYGHVNPSVSGTAYGVDVDNMANSYGSASFSYKADYGSKFSYAIIVDSPFGASVSYPTDASPYIAGVTADVSSLATTLLLQYQISNRFSVYGGVRAQQIEATHEIPGASYDLSVDRSLGFGYSLGAAYEIPEYALRASLTYHSAIEHDVTMVENTALETDKTIETPQSVNFEFQTGINDKTLIFASARWVDWSEFEISAPGYTAAIGGPIISYEDDVISYSIGIGRKITDQWSLAGSIGYEAAQDGDMDLLAPTDGKISYGLAAIYQNNGMKIKVGGRYINLGDDEDTESVHSFTDNSALGLGISISKSF